MDTILAIVTIAGFILSSNVFVALVVSRRERRKIAGEALDATGSGIQKIVASSIDLVEEYRKDFDRKTTRISDLEAEIRLLNKRLDEEVEKRLGAEAFVKVLEEKSIEQRQELERLRKEMSEFKREVLN